MPTTTTGVATSFIEFTRASNATVTDSDGKVKWAPHNLLTNSESFDAASWARYLVATVTANAAVAPNGTTTADVVSVSASGSLYSSVSVIGGAKYKISVWAKRNAGSNQTFVLYGGANISSDLTATADWQLFEYEFTAASTASINCGFNVGSGNAAFNVHLWGASLYRSDLAMQPNTSAYPMYNPTTPKNLLGYTEDFSNAAWTKTGLAATPVIANTVVAPNGLQTADKIVENSSASTHLVAQSAGALLASPYVASVYAKAAERSFVSVGFDGLNAWFNLSTGAVGTVESGLTATITSAGNGWYRCAVYRTVAVAATKTFGVYVATANNVVSYTGDGTSGIYLWGAQLSDSASLDSYSPVYGAAVTSAAYYGPRRDFDPVTLACKGLLFEEQRANSFLYSAAFDNAAWQKGGLNAFGSGSVANTTATASPTGAFDASFIQENTSASTHEIRQISITVTSGISYTSSIYVKAAGRTRVQFQYFDGTANAYPSFNISTGTLIGANGADATSIVPVGNGWYRISVTKTSASTSASVYLYMDNGSGTSYTGDGTSGLYIWGAQLEANAPFATSYIPTGAATATRNADVASVSTQAFPYSATEGTVVVNASVVGGLTGSNNAQVSLNDGTVNNSHLLYLSTAAPTYGTNVGGVPQQGIGISAVTVTANTAFKSALAYKANDFAGTANGATVVTNTSGTVPTGLTIMNIGNYASNLRMNGHIRQITYLPRRISNAELVTRSA